MTETYVVEITRLAAKDLKKLSAVEKQIIDELRKLQTDPKKGHTLSQNLQGVRSLEFSIKGSGEYRAVYLIREEERRITVFLIATHANVYEEAARRMKLIKDLVKKVREKNRERGLKH